MATRHLATDVTNLSYFIDMTLFFNDYFSRNMATCHLATNVLDCLGAQSASARFVDFPCWDILSSPDFLSQAISRPEDFLEQKTFGHFAIFYNGQYRDLDISCSTVSTHVECHDASLFYYRKAKHRYYPLQKMLKSVYFLSWEISRSRYF